MPGAADLSRPSFNQSRLNFTTDGGTDDHHSWHSDSIDFPSIPHDCVRPRNRWTRLRRKRTGRDVQRETIWTTSFRRDRLLPVPCLRLCLDGCAVRHAVTIRHASFHPRSSFVYSGDDRTLGAPWRLANLPLWRHLPTLALWFGPSLIGLPILVYALARHPLARRSRLRRSPRPLSSPTPRPR